MSPATLKPPRHIWTIVGKKKGNSKSRVMLISFGLKESPEAALRAVQSRCSSDPQFRKDFAGWQFLPAKTDFYLEIGEDGKAAVLHYNDREVAL